MMVAMLLFALTTVKAQEYNAPKFGKGLFNLVGKDSSWTMKIGLRAQFLATSTWEDGASNETSFLIRRSRLKFDGYAYSPKLKYKIELGLSNSDLSGASQFTSNAPRYILDAVLMWNFAPNLEFWFGQTKLPGNRERVVSSSNLQMVDRSLLNSVFTIDRDMGMQLRHHFDLTNKFVVKEIVSLAQGEGRNVTTGNLGGYQYTTRLELFPFGDFEDHGDYSGGDLSREETPKLSLAAAYDFNNNAVKNRSNQGSYMANDSGFYETNTSTLFVDAMFKYNGFSFMAEYADRSAEDPYAKNADGSPLLKDGNQVVVEVGEGFNLQTGYLFKSNWEVSGRYTSIMLDKNITGKNPENQYTLGVSKYIVGHHLKIQSDISHLQIKNDNDELMFRLQCELSF